jgi:predicted cupin superfamily sugar epimerase
MHEDARATIDRLGLEPHPEGGFYRETFRAPLVVGAHGGARSASTAIYFLLPSGTLSALHRVRSDEVWHHYHGDSVELHTIDPAGCHTVSLLGGALATGELPQRVVPAGVWQAAVPLGGRFALCGCTVAPGFDFADFDMPDRPKLLDLFPAHRATIEKLTRPKASGQ